MAGGRGDGGREMHRRVTFQCQLYNAFYYAGALLWGNTAMKKEEDVETSGGGRKGQKKKEIALPGFHIESLRSSGTFTPSPSPRHWLPPSRPPIQSSRRPRRLLTLNFLSCITALRLSSRVKKKKKYKWKKPARRRERPCLRGKGVLRQICRSPSSVSSPGRPLSPSLHSCFFFFFFFTANAEA